MRGVISRMRPRSRLVLATTGLILCLWLFFSPSHDQSTCDTLGARQVSGSPTPGGKVIDGLISDAQRIHESFMQSTTPNLEDAVRAYHARRGRPPPPGFDKWHKRAVKTSSVAEERFFDQIHEDLEPFWGVDASNLRGSYTKWNWVIEVRDGKVHAPPGRFRSRTWGKMIQRLAEELPDMDIPINPLDEPRVFAPWHVVNDSIAIAAAQRERMALLRDDQILTRAAKPLIQNGNAQPTHEWITEGAISPHFWSTCLPDTLDKAGDTTASPVTNWTSTKDICANRHVANLHGALIAPASMDITTSLIPIFSAAKLQGNNDILLPPPSYYSDDYLFTGRGWFGDGSTSVPWHKKIHGLIWRGKATGGEPGHLNTLNFHRHRLVSLLNASESSHHAQDPSITWPETASPDSPTARDANAISTWLRQVSNAAFTDLFLPTPSSATTTSLLQHFSLGTPIPMKSQYRSKYLPDIDGNSLSGRFRAFLLSNSAPLKATIFKEWHDARLVPWAHFIPVEISLRDLWAVMAYFLGFGGVEGRDEEGRRIACQGMVWAERALRREDMEVYALRVLLEWARVSDGERERLGFVVGR